MRSYIVVGLGRFGGEVARQLFQMGCDPAGLLLHKGADLLLTDLHAAPHQNAAIPGDLNGDSPAFSAQDGVVRGRLLHAAPSCAGGRFDCVFQPIRARSARRPDGGTLLRQRPPGGFPRNARWR